MFSLLSSGPIGRPEASRDHFWTFFGASGGLVLSFFSLLPTSEFLIPSFYFRVLLPTSYFRVPTSCVLLPTADFLLPTSYFRVRTSEFLLPTADFLLPSSDFLVPTSESLLPHFLCLLHSSWPLLPTSVFLLPSGPLCQTPLCP